MWQNLGYGDGVTSIDDFKQMGYLVPALVNYMTLLGWSDPDAQELFTQDVAAGMFDFDRVNRNVRNIWIDREKIGDRKAG